MIEPKAPSFFKYFDYSTGKMKKDAPASAVKAYKAWQKEGRTAEKTPKRTVKKSTKKQLDLFTKEEVDLWVVEEALAELADEEEQVD